MIFGMSIVTLVIGILLGRFVWPVVAGMVKGVGR